MGRASPQTRLTVGGGASRHQLPQHQPEGVHVDAQEGVALEVDGALQNLGCHVAPRSNLQKGKGQRPDAPPSPLLGDSAHLSMSVSCRLSCLKLERQAKVGDAGGKVVLQQHILALDVSTRAKPQKDSQLRRTPAEF